MIQPTVKSVLIPLLAASILLLVWFPIVQASRPPLWGYLVWATYLLMQNGLGSRPPGSRVTLLEVLLVPCTLALMVGVLGVAVIGAKRVAQLPDAGVIAVAIVSGLFSAIALYKVVARLRERGGE